MAESDEISTKRMRLSSSSAQTLTTSKTRSQIPSNGSGRILSAAYRPGNRLSGEKLDRKAPPRAYPRVTIKDLRLRRVLPPSSISNNWEFNWKGENLNSEHGKEPPRESQNPNDGKKGSKDNIDRLGDSREDREASELTQMTPQQFSSETVSTLETNGSKVNGVSEKRSATNLRTKSVLHPCSRAKIFKNPASFSYRRLLPYLMEAADATSSGQNSKPSKSFEQVRPCIDSQDSAEDTKTRNAITQDPKDQAGKLMTVNDRCGETEHVPQSADSISSKPASGTASGSTCSLKKTTESSPDRNSVFSKRKLFKTPGSVNYRRLLPYLKDIPEDSPHTRKNAEENALSVLAVSENVGAQGMLTSDATRVQSSSDDSVSQPLEYVSEPSELSDPGKEQETQVKHVIPDSEKHLGIPCEVLGSETPVSFVPDSRNSSDLATSTLTHTSVDTVVEAKISDAEMSNGTEKSEEEKSGENPKANGLNSEAVLLEASVTPSASPPAKGIMKRKLHGCRGICTCLNCSSFRLHAERAFEFSRNQLQDTEETVLDLVGEITHLRDMLEKHASADHAESCPIQVKEACRRASEAAEVAKSRLNQMNDDLQAHSRIPIGEQTLHSKKLTFQTTHNSEEH